MPNMQLIQNGVTSVGSNPFFLDMSPSVNQFIKGQEIEQERRRRVIQNNQNDLDSTDLSRLSQIDLEGSGIQDQYNAYKALGMDTSSKDFNKHDAELRAAHTALQNNIGSAMNVRKTNMAMYDDLKSLLPPDELMRLQEDMKKPAINSDGTQNILNPSSYKLKPKDYLNVNKLVLDAIDQNTNKPENLKEVKRKDGKYNKLTGARINVENALKYLNDSYNNDTKTRESVDNAVSQLNKLNPGGVPITAKDYLQNQVESNIVSKQSDRMKELYPDGVFKPGGKEAYVNVNPITPNEWVSHVTVKAPSEDKASLKQLGLYTDAMQRLNRAIIQHKDPEGATAAVSRAVKGGILEGNMVTGAEVIRKGEERGIRVIYQDPIEGKLNPKEYWGAQALRQVGLLHNSKAKSPEAIVTPQQTLPVHKSEPPVKETLKKTTAKPKTTKFKGVPTGGF